MVGIFSALGIGVSVAIIGFGGGFSGGSASSLFNPPTNADIYTVGAQVTDGLSMGYTLDSQGPRTVLKDANVSITFHKLPSASSSSSSSSLNGTNTSWRTTINIVNGTHDGAEQLDVELSKQLSNIGGINESKRPFLEPVESSILNIRDMDYGGRAKYLVKGAPWNTIVTGTTPITVRVTNDETVTTPAGQFHTFVLSYKLKNNISKIYVVKDLPLPVKAETFDADDHPYYKYELVSLTR
jgi:hypothetical protein